MTQVCAACSAAHNRTTLEVGSLSESQNGSGSQGFSDFLAAQDYVCRCNQELTLAQTRTDTGAGLCNDRPSKMLAKASTRGPAAPRIDIPRIIPGTGQSPHVSRSATGPKALKRVFPTMCGCPLNRLTTGGNSRSIGFSLGPKRFAKWKIQMDGSGIVSTCGVYGTCPTSRDPSVAFGSILSGAPRSRKSRA